jgi:Dolichyl-phosphate-mannose-protein mannosyltransferase
MAALICFGLSAFTAFRLPPFFGADERPHFAYTVTLLDGHLPEVTDRQPFSDRYPIIERSLDPPGPAPPRAASIWVASHPPLTYAITAPVVRLAGAGHSDELPTLGFRLVNAVAMAAGAALAGLLAAELFSRHRGIAVSAAALTAVVPNLVAIGGYAQNDGPAFALTTACLLVSARLLRRGLSTPRLATASLLAGAALLTRASAAVAVAAVVTSAVVAAWRRGGGVWRAVVRATGAVLLIGAASAASAGWFYWRNERLYGTATGDTFLLDAFERPPRGGLADVLIDGGYNGGMWSGLFGAVHPRLSVAHPGWVVAALVAVAVVGLVAAAARRLLRRHDSEVAAQDPIGNISSIGGVGWLIIVGFCAGVIVATAQFYAKGGGPHPRYLFSLVPVVSALLARALVELPWRRTALAVVVGGLLAVTGSQFARYPDLIDDPTHNHPFADATAGLLAQSSAGALVAGAFTALLAWLCTDWWRGREARGDTAPAGRSDGAGNVRGL